MRKRRYRPEPAPPADAESYILVKSKEGPYWRRKRGSLTKAKLNKGYQKSANATSIVSPAAKRIRDKLDEFLINLQTGRFIANVSGKLRKIFNKTGELDFSLLNGYELQPYFPLSSLFTSRYHVSEKNNELTVHILLHKNAVKRLNSLVTGYYFEVVLLSGDPGKPKGLRTDSEISPLYGFGEKRETECRLSLALPAKKVPWMLLLKVSCLEDNALAHHPRHYGMKVIKVGGK
ncbi:MAG: hypothetical protein Q8941_18225 [Bacteroidota bacterium]|nr:hypothetical protein [Bacteroidota bacterium]